MIFSFSNILSNPMSEHMTVAQNLKAACKLHDKNNNSICIWQQNPPKDTV
jgi:hypothetical protein